MSGCTNNRKKINDLLKIYFPCSNPSPHHRIKNSNFAIIDNEERPLRHHSRSSEEGETRVEFFFHEMEQLWGAGII